MRMRRRFIVAVLCAVALAILVGAAPVAAAGDWPTYVVKPGDTLSRIAARHNVTLSALISVNGIRRPYTIYTGQMLVIPDAKAPIRIGTPHNWEVVNSPITITGRSTTFEGALSVRIRDRWGRELARAKTTGGSMGGYAPFSATLAYTVPYAQWGSVEAYALSAATGVEVNTVGQKVYLSKTGAGPTYRTYVVQRGDTLLRIARRYGTTWRILASLNGLANPNRIYSGQRLRLP